MLILQLVLTVFIVCGFCVTVRGTWHFVEAWKSHKGEKPRNTRRVVLLQPEKQTTATTITVATVTGSALLLLLGPTMIHAFYGKDVDDRLNEAVGSYLSAVGLLYGLVVAHLLHQGHDRLVAIQSSFAEELALLHSLVDDDLDLLTALKGYVESMIAEIEERVNTDIALTLPSRREEGLPQYSSTKTSLLVCRYKRNAMRKSSLGWIIYLLNFLLCNTMYFGVLLIPSGSNSLNLTFCLTCIVVIGLATYIVADLDSPYSGNFRVDSLDAYELLRTIQTALSSAKRILPDNMEQDVESFKA